jgi:cellulose synthase/poly-beta-1,6-N-acetylglucosamine synthase-like glycosyltransferase
MDSHVMLLVVLLVLGFSTVLWTSLGLLRFVGERPLDSPRARAARGAPAVVPPSRVAVLVAAHDEALVISETIRTATALVPASNVHVVSDGSHDGTAAIARAAGVQVLELDPNRGKAGALAAGLEHFDLCARFEVVVLLDADTRLTPDYLATGLPFFDDPGVVAVAGRARSMVERGKQSLTARILLAYRERLYVVVQLLLKYGQASRPVNVVAIVPGFASMYRTAALAQIDIAAPNLIIEDYNMTFEVHAKKLGRIAFHPAAAQAYTQDPDNLRDYVRQVRRWTLGYWQTLRRHGLHRGKFWAALGLHTVELVLSSVMLLLVVPLLLLSLVSSVDLLRPQDVLLGVLVPDFLLTVLATVSMRRPAVLLLGLAFPVVRTLDAVICLSSMFRAWAGGTSGTWVSPTRRPQPEDRNPPLSAEALPAANT